MIPLGLRCPFALGLAAAFATAACGAIPKVRDSVPVTLDLSSPYARDLPPVALLHVRRPLAMQLLTGPWSEPEPVEGDLMVSADRILFDPRVRPVAVPALGNWASATLYAPGVRVTEWAGGDVYAARRNRSLALPWPPKAEASDDLLVAYAEEPIEAPGDGWKAPFRLRRRGDALFLAAAPGWTASFPGGDPSQRLHLLPDRWDRAVLETPRLQAPTWAGEDRCDLTLERPAADAQTEFAYLLAARADRSRGTVAWLWGRRVVPQGDPENRRYWLLGSLSRVVDATGPVAVR